MDFVAAGKRIKEAAGVAQFCIGFWRQAIDASSFEECWLRSSLLRFAKIAQTNPYEPVALLCKVDSFSQLQRDVRQFFAGRWR